MDFPRLTPKQYAANGALVAVGAIGVWLGAAPRGHGAWQPFEFFLGMTCVLFGLIATTAKRWHVVLVVLALFAAIPRAFASVSIWSLRHPDFHPTVQLPADDHEERLFAENRIYGTLGVILGALSVPLAAAASAAIRKLL